ncbi:MAG: 30S ribosomal protein S16 [Candidatus Shapirobacteria bacterium]
MLKIKLFQRGKKGQITYRVVVAEAKSKRDGKFTADLGHWNPDSKTLKIDQKELVSWQEKGAQLTEGVRKILKNEKIS